MAITCWYCATAFTALLQACRIDQLSKAANEELTILNITAKQLQSMWPSANIISRGFERLRATASTPTDSVAGRNEPSNLSPALTNRLSRSPSLRSETANCSRTDDGGINWKDYFPFATPATSEIAEKLLHNTEHSRPADELFFPGDEEINESMMMQLEEFFGLFDENSFNVSDMTAFM
jgi:hypothetical protein